MQRIDAIGAEVVGIFDIAHGRATVGTHLIGLAADDQDDIVYSNRTQSIYLMVH